MVEFVLNMAMNKKELTWMDKIEKQLDAEPLEKC